MVGDLFDHPHVGFKVVLDAYIAIDAATQATGNEILLLAGNHDLPRNLEVVGAFEMLEALLDGHPKVTTVRRPWIKDGLALFPWRSEERRVGNEGYSTFRYQWSLHHSKKK